MYVSKYYLLFLCTYVQNRAVVAILKLVGPGPYPPKKSGGARARFYPISAKKWWGPGPTGPYRDSSPAYMMMRCVHMLHTYKEIP